MRVAKSISRLGKLQGGFTTAVDDFPWCEDLRKSHAAIPRGSGAEGIVVQPTGGRRCRTSSVLETLQSNEGLGRESDLPRMAYSVSAPS